MKRITVVIFVILFLRPFSIGAEELPEQDFKAVMNPWAVEIYRREPVKATFRWQNISSDDQKLFIQSQEFFVYVAFGSEEFKRYRLFYPQEEEILEHLSPIWSVSVLLKPREGHEHSRWLLLAKADTESEWQFLFDKPGVYHVAMNADGKDAAEIAVKDVNDKKDKQALELFSQEGAQLFLGENLRAQSAEDSLKNIFSKYPQSLYAPCAALGLANDEWQKKSGFDLNFPAFSQYLDLIIDKHFQNRPLFEEALFLKARALAFQEGGQEKALEYFFILQKEFPASPYILKLQNDHGIGLELIPR